MRYTKKAAYSAILLSYSITSLAGIYSGPTDTATYNSLLSQVNAKYTALTNKISAAETAGVNTDYAQTSKTTVRIFKDIYVPYDYANPSVIQAKYDANTWKSQHDPVGPIVLPFDELSDCIELADAAIAELDAQIAGNIVLQPPADFSTGGVTLNGTHYEQGGKTVFPHYFFWHPFDEDIMQAYGRMGEGYLALTDMQDLDTAKNYRHDKLVDLITNQNTANRAPMQFFLGHVDNNSSWHRSNYPDAFNVGDRLFTDYDIDYPLVQTWLNQLFTNMLVDAVAAAGSEERIHMLANEPAWSIRQGGVHADQNVSIHTFNKFETWLQNKYTSIGSLNGIYSTGYSDFAQAASANYVTNSGVNTALQGGPIWYDWCRFNMDRVNDWFSFLHDGVKGIDPAGNTHVKITGDRSAHAQWHDEGLDFEFINQLVDMPGSDNQMTSRRAYDDEYYQRLHDGAWYDRYNLEWRAQSFMVDFVKSINPEKAFYDSEWHGLSGARWRDFHMEPANVRQSLWLAFTQGVSAMNAWVWCRYDGTESWPIGVQNGQPQDGSEFFGECTTQPLQLDAWGRTMKELNAHGDAVASLVPAERNYLVYYALDAAIQDDTYTAELADVYEALKVLNVPVGFATASTLPSITNANQTLIISPTAFLSDAELAGLQTFEAGGGVIILVEPAASFLKNEQGFTRAGGSGLSPFGTIALNDVFTMADDLATVLAPRKPALPVTISIADTNGVPQYGVLASQHTDGNTSYVSLINVSTQTCDVSLQLLSGNPLTVTNAITGQATTSSLTMEPMDVLLLQLTDNPPPPSGPWYDYVAQYGLSGIRTNNTDLDLLNDWAEYVFGGDPTNGNEIGTLPSFNAASGIYAFDLRNDTSLVARVVTKTNLTDAVWSTNQSISVAVNDGSVSNRIAAIGTSEAQLFIKVVVDETSGPVTGPTTNILVIGAGGSVGIPSSGNGNFEAGTGTGNGYELSLMPNWFNLSGWEGQTSGTDVGMGGSPEPNSQGCWLFTSFTLGNDTGHAVTAAGETFHLGISGYPHGNPANYDGDEKVVMMLFTSADPAGVDAGTGIADITVLSTARFDIGSGWETFSASNVYTTVSGDIGETIYLGLTLENPTGNNAFPRFDLVRMEVEK